MTNSAKHWQTGNIGIKQKTDKTFSSSSFWLVVYLHSHDHGCSSSSHTKPIWQARYCRVLLRKLSHHSSSGPVSGPRSQYCGRVFFCNASIPAKKFSEFDLTLTGYNYGLKTSKSRKLQHFWNALDVPFHMVPQQRAPDVALLNHWSWPFDQKCYQKCLPKMLPNVTKCYQMLPKTFGIIW